MNALDIVKSQVKERVSVLCDTITSGKADTYEEYKRLCGEIKGLLTAEDYIETLKNKLENSDDE